MKLLLTGASGYLGRHVLQRLRERDIEVVAIGRKPPPGLEGQAFVRCDLLDTVDLRDLLQPLGATHLLHLAWYAEHGKYWNSLLNLRWVDATLRLLQAFAETGGRHAALAGSCAEYDWASGYLREASSPMLPQGLYGKAKDATRRLAQALVEVPGPAQKLSLAWCHVFWPFGPGEACERMLPSLVEVFRGQAAPFGVNATACIGDVVRILAQLCDADPAPVLALAAVRPGDPPMLVGDNSLLRSSGWRQSQTLEQGLALLVAQQPSAAS